MENFLVNVSNLGVGEEMENYYPESTSDPLDSMVTNFTDTLNDSITSNKTLELPMFYSLPYKIVGCLLVSVIFIVGFIGNLMVIIVVSRTRTMHTPTNCYLVSLAIADCILLLSAALPTVFEYFLMIGQWIWGSVGCSTVIFLQYLGIDASSLSITAFTVERYIAICHPMKAQTICTVNRAKRIIACLWVLCVLYCSPWLGLTITKRERYRDGSEIVKCTYKLKRSSYLIIYMTDLFIFYVIPLVLTGILYGLIGWILFTSTVPSTPGKAAPNDHRKSPSQSRVQVIKMLVVVVGMFATLWMPYRIMVVYNSFQPQEKRYTDLWFILFCRIMVYMNSAINPILYNAMSMKFRRAFKKLLLCRRTYFDVKSYMYSEVPHDAQYRKRQSVNATNGNGNASIRRHASEARSSKVSASRNGGAANGNTTDISAV